LSLAIRKASSFKSILYIIVAALIVIC
jgi:hypothetical protein